MIVNKKYEMELNPSEVESIALRSMTFVEKATTKQTSCCDSLQSFEGAVSFDSLNFIYKTTYIRK